MNLPKAQNTASAVVQQVPGMEDGYHCLHQGLCARICLGKVRVLTYLLVFGAHVSIVCACRRVSSHVEELRCCARSAVLLEWLECQGIIGRGEEAVRLRPVHWARIPEKP
jgi:hypothetical protein